MPGSSAYAGAGGGAAGSGRRACSSSATRSRASTASAAPSRGCSTRRATSSRGAGRRVLACDHTRRNAPEVLAARQRRCSSRRRRRRVQRLSRAHHRGRRPAGEAGVFALPRVRASRRGARRRAASPCSWRDTLTTPRLEPEEVLRDRRRACRGAIGRCVGATAHARAAGRDLCAGRKRESLRLVAQALARACICPFAAVEDPLCSTRPRRATWSRCSTCWCRRATLSLAQALRSPVFGASDDDLLALGARAGARRPVAELVGRAGARADDRRRGAASAPRAAAAAGAAAARRCRRTTCSTASSPKASCASASPRRCRRRGARGARRDRRAARAGPDARRRALRHALQLRARAQAPRASR